MSHNGQFLPSEFSDEPTVSPELRQLTMATCASNLVRSPHTHTHTHTQGAHTQPRWPESGLRPHSWGGCIIVTGFRSLAVKQFHAVNRKCNRRRVSILVSRQFTRHTKDNALQEQFLPMRTLSPLTQAKCLYSILLSVDELYEERFQICWSQLNSRLWTPTKFWTYVLQGLLMQHPHSEEASSNYYFKSSSLKPLSSHFFHF